MDGSCRTSSMRMDIFLMLPKSETELSRYLQSLYRRPSPYSARKWYDRRMSHSCNSGAAYWNIRRSCSGAMVMAKAGESRRLDFDQHAAPNVAINVNGSDPH